MTTSQPTRGASEESHSWGRSPVLAFAVRALAFLAPLFASWLAIKYTGRWFWRPEGLGGLAIWIVQALAVGYVASRLTDRITARLLPIAALLNMSLVFPDAAPSRFGVALRSGTLKKLQARIADLDANGLGDDTTAAAEKAVELVGLLGAHDPLTRGHTERVRAYADLIAEEMGLDQHSRDRLAWSVMLHDIGKLCVPSEILNKESKLTDEEWAILRDHPKKSQEILTPLASWLGDWDGAAGEHHERWDGNGYPLGLAGREISLAGRITAVADAYDVITSRRSYKKAMSAEAARQELVRCSGKQFDPDVVRAMLRVSLGRRQSIGPLAWLAELPRALDVVTAVAPAASAAPVAAVAVLGATALAPMAEPPADLAFKPTTTISAPAQSDVEQALPEPSELTTTIVPTASTSSSTVDQSTSIADAPTTTAEPEVPSEESTTAPPTTLSSTALTTSPPPSPLAQVTTSAPRALQPSTTGSPRQAPPSPPSTSPPTTRRATTTTAPPSTTTTTTTTTVPTTTTTQVLGPITQADVVTVEDDKGIRIFVLDNDLDGPDPIDPEALTIVVEPLHADSFRVHDDHIHYKSEKDYEGVDVIVYEVCDVAGVCSTGTLTITVED